MRVAIGSIVHEANTFSPQRVDWAAVQAHPFLAGDDVIARAASLDTAIPGFLTLADQTEVEWVPLISSALPGGAGPLTVEAFERLGDELVGRLARAGAVDACLLSMGGGMVADRQDLEDADGLLMTAVRQVLPAGGRLGVALDMHANVTERMVEAADVMLAYQTFPPHWDKHDVGGRVADLVRRALEGEIEPVMALARPPMLLQPEAQDTLRSPMRDALEIGRRASRTPGVLAVTLVAGFAWCDVPEAGTSVIVVTDRDRDLAARVADGVARGWFDLRDEFRAPLTPIDEAVGRALAHRGPRPLLLCDPADNAGAGGAGDSTTLLERMLARGVTNAAFATLCDGEAVAACVEAGVGGAVDLDLGGKLDPAHSRPIRVGGAVRALSDGRYRNSGPLWNGAAGNLGRTAVIDAGGVEIVVTERPNGAFDPAVFTSVGIDPTRKAVLVVRSQIFGPKSYAGLVDGVVVVDGDGLATSNFAKLPYRRLRRPIFPLDAGVAFP